MPAPRTSMPQWEAIRALADRALASPSGVTVRFTLAKHGSEAACKHLARSFQKRFTSMRAWARKMDDSTVTLYASGPYDRLDCQPTPTDDGWHVHLIPRDVVELDAVDIRTGEEINLNKSEFYKLIERAQAAPHTITRADFNRAEELNPSSIPWHIDDNGRAWFNPPVGEEEPEAAFD